MLKLELRSLSLLGLLRPANSTNASDKEGANKSEM